MHILFVCSRNRLRSPTAEAVVSAWEGVTADSAGTAPDAETRLSSEQVEDADIIMAMEGRHRRAALRAFPRETKGKKIVVLDIPDRYGFMQPELVTLVEGKLAGILGRPPRA